MNLIIFIFELTIFFGFLYLCFKHKISKKTLILLFVILSSIMGMKLITINATDIQLGLILSTSIYILCNILIQKKGIEEINCYFKELIFYIFIFMIILFSGEIITFVNTNDLTIMDLVYIPNIKIILSNSLALIIGIYINSYLYYDMKKSKNNIILSTISGGLLAIAIECLIFSVLTFNFNNSIILFITSICYKIIIKSIILILGIPLIYKFSKI